MKGIGLFATVFFVAVRAAAEDHLAGLDWLIGEWHGTIAQEDVPFATEVSLTASRQGRLMVLDLERKQLFQPLKERIYFDWNQETKRIEAVSDSPYVAEPRRDKVTITDKAINMRSEPWNIGSSGPLLLQWSLASGKLIPPQRTGRIYIDAPTFVPDSNAIVMTWSGVLGEQSLGIEQGTLIRKGSLVILR